MAGKTGSGSLNVAALSTPDIEQVEADAGPAPCPAIDRAKLLPFELDTKKLPHAPPDIVDEQHVLAHFHRRVAELARGTATDHVRIGMYGDSNMTMDYITGQMRRTLQARFGDAGHGYVALGRPWPWYLHQDVRHDVDLQKWRMFATSTHRASDGQYGFANIAAESSTPGARTWVQTAPDGSPIGKSVSHFEVYYLKGPARGSFDVKIDGKLERTIATASTETEAAFEKFDVTDGPHKLEISPVGNGKVRVFGATLEREVDGGKYGITVDSLGVGALNFEQMQHVNSKTRIEMLKHRKYDLVIFLLGTNMFVPSLHGKWVHNVLADFREALPETPILILSPPDIVLHGSDEHSDPRIVELAKQMRDIAQKENAAFWDFREAMGGDASIKKFVRSGLAAGDYVHLSRDGGALMGDRLVHSLFKDLQKWVEANPTAGCPNPSGP
jgi:lysophospholipase L1-like esterase